MSTTPPAKPAVVVFSKATAVMRPYDAFFVHAGTARTVAFVQPVPPADSGNVALFSIGRQYIATVAATTVPPLPVKPVAPAAAPAAPATPAAPAAPAATTPPAPVVAPTPAPATTTK